MQIEVGSQIMLLRKEIKIGFLSLRAKAVGTVTRVKSNSTHKYEVEFYLSNQIYIGCVSLREMDVKLIKKRTIGEQHEASN